MFIRNGLFSSESVSEGHPDKLADRISDAVLDEFLKRDPEARVACETLLGDGYVIAAGEFKTRHEADFEDVRARTPGIIRKVLRDAGDRDAATGIDPERCEIQVRFNRQSADSNRGVDREDVSTPG
ncbi:MAG: S-adenosylmethionine synthetase N-terminal domain-containing protein [Hyphomonas sp.]